MMAAVRPITNCRLCGGPELEPCIDFGAVPLGNNLQETANAARAAEEYPLELRRCAACSHFQLGHAVEPEVLYATNYTYLSGIGSSFVRHFGDYARWAVEEAELALGSFVVDVGSNDGTCLKAFHRLGHNVCGVDPAALAARIANEAGIETLNRFFDAAAVAEIVARHGQADFVTSHNVLAHVDDLAAVFRNVHALLRDGGYFGFEIGYFREVLRKGCFDTIYHEHLDYHHAAPLARHLGDLGFELLHLSVNDVQGGSLRLLFRKTGRASVAPQPQGFLEQEQESVLYDRDFLVAWKQRIEAQMAQFREMLQSRARAGRSIIAYGAPTKATLLMKLAGVGSGEVSFVVEDNPHKAGRFLPRTAIPIRPSSALDEAQPDVIVMLAWNFADEIIEKLRGELPGTTEIVVPLPELRTVNL